MERPVDKLTGLISGAVIYPEMEALIARGSEFAVVFIDIDGLYAINRGFGREAGDDVFRLIAGHIGDIFGDPSLAFRDARDEFVIVMPGGGKEDAFIKAERLRVLVCEERLGHTSADGIPLTQSISAGVSSFPDDGVRPDDVCRRAESAMIRAKKNGRNAVCLAREEKLIPKTSHYTRAQLEKLSVMSGKLNAGESALLREALDDLLKKYDVNDL